MFIHIGAHMHVCVLVYVCKGTCPHAFVCVCVCVYLCMYMCVVAYQPEVAICQDGRCLQLVSALWLRLRGRVTSGLYLPRHAS